MFDDLHFISGLPRSGSTLLGALLRQNPAFHAGMSSPVAGICERVLAGMSPRNDFSALITPAQRRSLLLAPFRAYHEDVPAGRTIFDTNRSWCAKLPLIAELFPAAKVIVCVRELLWVLDSFERVLRRNALGVSTMFKASQALTVFSRVGALTGADGAVGFAWHATQDAFYGEHAARLVVVDYEALARTPQRALTFIYEALGLPAFEHDVESVAFDEGEAVDARLGMPGLHAVRARVEYVERQTILPPELCARFGGADFWRRPELNPRGVKVLLPDVPGDGARVLPRDPEALAEPGA